ncbi:fumarylacetoacetate hydrolase family protein [Streptomyces sp. VNUA24]|uniref:fumarylacetoacetate hydrolase family protein n=1 Tax=Streptomyces sp. VNUA24 TaxID=3031131 RepID=UPI0023B78D64|nr:fumarylacetoacetate hydrolase family protein [Streptomyces sp. VNUA24]WEH13226.1 fumarylacetoacetate hydrolase family protein [Streptomyces sp. VNUA24]
MKFANIGGRAHLIAAGLCFDLEQAGAGRFSSDPQAVYARWDELTDWAAAHDLRGGRPYRNEELLTPVPRPHQIFAIGLNYRAHADEAEVVPPKEPMVFTKYASSLTGPTGPVALTGTSVDWEVELVVVIGRTARCVPAERAWEYVAGLTVGQDLSDRERQFTDSPPQFSLAKSAPGFSPVGPYVVTTDEVPDPDDLALECSVNGEVMQRDRTSSMLFGVGELIARLSRVLPLLPGDLLFTGTPAGVGLGRTPRRFLHSGDRLVSRIEGLGEMSHVMTDAVTTVGAAPERAVGTGTSHPLGGRP